MFSCCMTGGRCLMSSRGCCCPCEHLGHRYLMAAVSYHCAADLLPSALAKAHSHYSLERVVFCHPEHAQLVTVEASARSCHHALAPGCGMACGLLEYVFSPAVPSPNL